jgi:hypothetical protein
MVKKRIIVKEIKTDRFKGLAVLVPNRASEFSIESPNILAFMLDNTPNDIKIDQLYGYTYEILGKATELTEDQCADITLLPMIREKDGQLGFMISCMDIEIYPTAVSAVQDFMQSLECYSENPYEESYNLIEEHFENNKCNITEVETVTELFEEAETNTGTWLILKKI